MLAWLSSSLLEFDEKSSSSLVNSETAWQLFVKVLVLLRSDLHFNLIHERAILRILWYLLHQPITMKFIPTVIFAMAAVSSTTATNFSPKNLRGRRHLSSESSESVPSDPSVPSAPSVDSVSSEDDRRHLSSLSSESVPSAPSGDSVSSGD